MQRLTGILKKPTRPAFLRRTTSSNSTSIIDVEAQLDTALETEASPAPSVPASTSTSARPSLHVNTNTTPTEPPIHEKSPRVVRFEESEVPPAYECVVSQSKTEDQPPCTPISIQAPGANGQQPTILVLFKEDYDWARAYLKDLDYKVALRRALRRHLYKWYAIIIIAITLSVLVSTKHTTIVDFCKPVTHKIRSWPAGWLVPIALLVVVSFPPLVGHEIIGILVGLVWGLGPGFGILAAGTFIGELATWVVFKWMCQTRAAKYEKRNKLYASLTQLIREKSFTFVLILRFSAIPGHIVTAVSASAGANLLSYSAAAFLTLPKQLILVYLGTSFGTHSKKDTIISWLATAATFIGTLIAAGYIYYQMRIVIRRGGASRLPVGDPRDETAGSNWEDVEVSGAGGVGAGVRMEIEDIGHSRRSVDVILGPHARAAQRQKQLQSPVAPNRQPRGLVRTRSLPGPISEDEMRTWLTQMDTALMTTTDSGTPQVRVTEPFDEKATHITDDDLANAGPTISRVEQGELEPIPYSSTLFLSPPALAASNPTCPRVPSPGLTDLAHEHVYPAPADAPSHPSRPPSGTLPAILLTPTYTPARSRADSLRGTVSLDIERPRLSGREIAQDSDMYAVAHGARRPNLSRTRGESSVGLLGRPNIE